MKKIDKSYFLRRLSMHNFMLHRHTNIELGKHPIILITGANGSGKTQILDALIVALGGHPKRLKIGKIADAIGPFADNATIELELYNPKLKEGRAIKIADKKLQKWTDSNFLKIAVKIEPDSTVNYVLHSSDQQHRVLRKEIRALLEALNLRVENKLAFTEEGTVNIFSDHSSKSKLDLLLKTTGLATYRENIAATLDSIDKAAHALDPLQRKMALEQEYLKSMEKTRELMEKRQKFLDKHRQLIVEEAWSQVHIVEEAVNDYKGRLENKQQNHSQGARKYRILEKQLKQQQSAWDRFDQEQRSLLQEARSAQDRMQILDGQNQSQRLMLQDIGEKIVELTQRRERLMDNAISKRKQQLEQELQQIIAKKEHLAQIRQNLGENFFSDQFSHERYLLQQSLRFYQQAAELGTIGPLSLHIQLKNNAPDYLWQAILQLLSIHCFSFIATDVKNFEQALELWNSLWPQQSPTFSIILIEKSEAPLDFVKKFLKAPAPVLHFLSRIVKARIPQNLPRAGTLWQMAQKKEHTFWHEGLIYTPWPSVGGSWYPQILASYPLIAIDEMEQALQATATYRQLTQQQQQINDEIADIGGEQELQHLQERLEESEQSARNLEQKIAENLKKERELQGKVSDLGQWRQEIVDKRNEVEEEMQTLEKQLQRLETEQDNLNKVIIALQQNCEEKERELQELSNAAKEQGTRPETLRTPKEVAEERSHLEGRLATLQIAPISEQEFLAQQERVEKLKTEVSGSSEHIHNLRQDVEKRFNKWHKEVAKRIQSLSVTMSTLLSASMQAVRLRVENLKNPNHAGLDIEIKRHSEQWLNLAHLSGGEKVLTVEALILALHLQTDSPVHALDEYTQRLDVKFKAQAFEMVQRAVVEIHRSSHGPFAPQFILLAPDTLGIDFPDDTAAYFKHIVLAPAHVKRGSKKHTRIIE